MTIRGTQILKHGALALALAATPLAGCSAGSSSFGSQKLEIAELDARANYTPDGTLAEAKSHFRNRNFGYSAAYYKKTAELSPKNPEAYIGLAASYDQMGRFDLADRVYDAWYKMQGASLQYYNNRGYSYMLRGDLKSAITAFRHASDLDPDNEVVNNNLMMLSDAVQAARA